MTPRSVKIRGDAIQILINPMLFASSSDENPTLTRAQILTMESKANKIAHVSTMKLPISITVLLLSTSQVLAFSPTTFPRTSKLCLKMGQIKVDRDWIADDMKKAGKAEDEGRDWVAEDMNKIGGAAAGPTGDWIAKDMKKAGEAGSEHDPHLRKASKKETETDKIAKDMKKTGRATGDDWIASDMKVAGDPEAQSTEKRTNWFSNILSRALDKEHDREYKDVVDDMKETGKMGSGSTELIAEGMKKTGMAESPMEKFFHDVTYKIDEWQKKTFDVETIREEMEDAGHARDTRSIAHDMESAGHAGNSPSHRMPSQKKDLQDMEDEKWIARDMKEGGNAASGWYSKRDTMTKQKRTDMIADDMKMAGRSADVDWIRQDMEQTGHAESHIGDGLGAKQSQYQRETEEFMKTRRVKMAPVEPEKVKEEKPEEKPEEKHKEHKFLRTVMKYAKKVIMPWRKLENL